MLNTPDTRTHTELISVTYTEGVEHTCQWIHTELISVNVCIIITKWCQIPKVFYSPDNVFAELTSVTYQHHIRRWYENSKVLNHLTRTHTELTSVTYSVSTTHTFAELTSVTYQHHILDDVTIPKVFTWHIHTDNVCSFSYQNGMTKKATSFPKSWVPGLWFLMFFLLKKNQHPICCNNLEQIRTNWNQELVTNFFRLN